MYHKTFLFSQLHREEFDQHYDQRAKAETTFGAIKQELGERLLPRNFPAQVNELVAKLVAYNITALIRQMFERNLLPDFLNPPEKPPPAVMPSVPDLDRYLLSLDRDHTAMPVVQSRHLSE